MVDSLRSPQSWTIANSADLYQTGGWSQGYFAISQQGELQVLPQGEKGPAVSLLDVVHGVEQRGYPTPLLLRFPDLLEDRLRGLAQAFQRAIEENDYQSPYRGVFPIKVNQQRPVVEEVLAFGKEHGFGLEVGSKPELLAVLALIDPDDDRLILCNGFKDERYIEAVLLASKLGRNILPIVEGYREARMILDIAERKGVHPRFGVRVKLTSQGSGRWMSSSGPRAKFGLFLSEVLQLVDMLRERDRLDCLELLHCHVGSQISDIRRLKLVVNELGQIYLGLKRMGAGLRYLDLGGGLGVDYDGTQRPGGASVNYTLDEYASDLVSRVANLCNQAGVEHPTLITESGRAMVAFPSMLVFNVLGHTGGTPMGLPNHKPDPGSLLDDAPQPLLDLWDAAHSIELGDRLAESWNDLLHAREEIGQLFSLGYLDLRARAWAEQVFWASCVEVRDLARKDDEHGIDLEILEDLLADTYYINMSVFQSLPDSWAIDQLFPVLPIHRLDEEPTRRAALADITCDSDGKIDRFLCRDDDSKQRLELHPLNPGEAYYLGAFLIGAYQETLGDLHNLFGDTHVAHVRVESDGRWWIDEVVPGDTVREVLQYVQFEPDRLARKLRRDCELAVADGRMTLAEGRALLAFYESGLSAYTYLEGPGEGTSGTIPLA